MIKKITIFYVDNTFEDVDSDYFNKSEASQDTNVKAIKEIFIYFTNGKYMKIVADISIEKSKIDFSKQSPNSHEIDDRGYPRKVDGPYDPYRPMFPSGPWFDPTKIVD